MLAPDFTNRYVIANEVFETEASLSITSTAKVCSQRPWRTPTRCCWRLNSSMGGQCSPLLEELPFTASCGQEVNASRTAAAPVAATLRPK